MAHAEKCPVCGGLGTLEKHDFIGTTSVYPPSIETCHGCNGLGWITVQDESTFVHPFPDKTGEVTKL